MRPAVLAVNHSLPSGPAAIPAPDPGASKAVIAPDGVTRRSAGLDPKLVKPDVAIGARDDSSAAGAGKTHGRRATVRTERSWGFPANSPGFAIQRYPSAPKARSTAPSISNGNSVISPFTVLRPMETELVNHMWPSGPTVIPNIRPEAPNSVTSPAGVIRERCSSEVNQRLPSGPATIRFAGRGIGNSVTCPDASMRPRRLSVSVNHIPPGPGVMDSGWPPEGTSNSVIDCARAAMSEEASASMVRVVRVRNAALRESLPVAAKR